MIRATLLSLCTLAGCASMSPRSVSVVVAHASHATQHPPLCRWVGEPASNYGYQTIGLEASWQRGPIWASVSDGYLLPGGYLAGPREIFSVRIGYTLWRKR